MVELFVALSLSVTGYILIKQFATGSLSNSTNLYVFSSCSIPGYHLDAFGDSWKGRLSGVLLSGWLFDFLVKNDRFQVDQYSCLFALYQSFWLFLLFLALILALRHSLFINLGIFAGLMYNFSPASGQYFYPWDLPAALFSTLACLFFGQRKTGMMIASLCFGCFFKESVLAFALLLFFISYWRWWKRSVGFLGVLAIYAIGKKLMLHYLHLEVAAFPVGSAIKLPTLFSLAFLKFNLTALLVPTWNHVLFVNAGTVAAVLVLGWSRRFLPFMVTLSIALGVQLMYGGFGEFHTFIQILPLSLMLLSERWQEYAGLGAPGQLSAEPAPVWTVRETFPVLVPMTVMVIGLSTGLAAWRYYVIFEDLQPEHQAQSEIGKHVDSIKSTGEVNDLAAKNQVLRLEYAEAELKLAMISQDKQQLSEAINHYQRVLELNSNSIPALNNLAWLRATAPDPGLRNGPEAVRLAEHGCQLSNYQEVRLLGTLAAAYAEAGRFNDAVVTAQKACAAALAQGRKDVADATARLLELYKTGRAYHQKPQAHP